MVVYNDNKFLGKIFFILQIYINIKKLKVYNLFITFILFYNKNKKI